MIAVGGDGPHVVQHHPTLGQHRPGLLRSVFQLLLALPVVANAGLEVLDVQVGGLRQFVEPFQAPLHVGQFSLGGLQPLALLVGDAVHLLIHQLDQLPDVVLGENVGTNPANHHVLEAAGVEPGTVAGPAAPFHQRLADVVGELPTLGVLAGHGAAAGAAFDQTAEQIGTAHPSGVRLPGSAGAQLPVDLAELGLGDDGGKRLLHPYRLALVLGSFAPDQSAGVGLVAQYDVDAVLGPGPSGGVGDALGVQGAGDVQDAPAGLGHIEDAFHYRGGGRVRFQGGALLGPVLDHELAVAVGHPAGDPEAPGGGFAHPPSDLFGKILAIELVHALDDGLHQLAGGGVVGVLGDGDDANAFAPEHGLERDGVFPLAGEP